MKEWLNFIYNKLRYDSFPQHVLNALKLIRIYIYPYFIYRENISSTKKFLKNNILQEFDISLAKKDDMQKILDFPDRMDHLEKLHNRLKRGDLCIAAWSEGKIVAFSWANLVYFEFLSDKLKLNEDEGYLYDAYTSSKYRGQKLAYFLRYDLYKILEERGKNNLYSVSIKSNLHAIKFKKNINAQIIGSGLQIDFFGKWRLQNKTEFEKSHN